MQLTVVMYHHVRESKDPKYPHIPHITDREFRYQINHFRKHYTFIDFGFLKNCIINDELGSLPENCVLLTFDDAHKDHYETVFPILVDEDIQGIFFTPSKAVLDRTILDVNVIHHLLKYSIHNLLNDLFAFLASNYPGEFSRNSLLERIDTTTNRFDKPETNFFKRLLQTELPDVVRSKALDYLFSKYISVDKYAFAEELYMDVRELKEMRDSGMHIGGHGYEHCWLNKSSDDKQVAEIKKTVKYMAEFYDDTDNWVMCYPYGGYNEFTIKTLQEQKCLMAFTTIAGTSVLGSDSLFTLKRFDTNDFPVS